MGDTIWQGTIDEKFEDSGAGEVEHRAARDATDSVSGKPSLSHARPPFGEI